MKKLGSVNIKSSKKKKGNFLNIKQSIKCLKKQLSEALFIFFDGKLSFNFTSDSGFGLSKPNSRTLNKHVIHIHDNSSERVIIISMLNMKKKTQLNN